MSIDYEREITEFIAHIEGWANGRIPKSDENLKRFEDVVSDDFYLVQSNSHILTGEQFLGWIRGIAYGSEPHIRARVQNIQLRWRNDNVVLAMFEEWKKENDDPETGVLSCVLFRVKEGTPNGLEWVHIHEANIPSE